jgi:hypothetical protein
MDAPAILDDMLTSRRTLPEDDIVWPDAKRLEEWAGGLPDAEVALFDDLAANLAKRYAAGEISFEEGDDIANQLWVLMIRRGGGWSHLLAEVYGAFDDGEWSHFGKSDDPVREFTDPAITEIVSRL